MITWSYSGRSSSRPASASCRVTARSSAEGVGIAARVVVDHDDPGCRLDDRGAEDLAGMDQRAVQQTTGDEDLAQHLALAVEGEEVELLHLQVAEAPGEAAATSSGSRMRWTGGRSSVAAGRRARRRRATGRPWWARCPPPGEAPARGRAGQAPERGLRRLRADRWRYPGAAAAPSRADQDAEQLCAGERRGPEAPESLARAVSG